MANELVEASIRDFLIGNLDFIEAGLVLIDKEYHLKNIVGAAGYVDILAKDKFNNYVIIEIKRSQTSSRQTIQELFKYIALLKQNYHARDSEIRSIIVSTHWGELLVPFSELRYQTTLDVKGIKLILDNVSKPISAEVVNPVTISALNRQFSPTYWFDLFFTEEKRNAIIPVLEEQCKRVGLVDFVILSMDAVRDECKQVMFPFATCFAFQSQSIVTYLNMLKDSEELDMDADEFETEAEFKTYLEDVLQCEILSSEFNDSGEIGSPEKLDAELTKDNWQIKNIDRYGAFCGDPRYDDELLIRELKGLDGNNPYKFLNICESSQQNRLSEIRDKCQIALKDNPEWKKHILQVFDYLQTLNTPYRLILNIYSPPSVFDGLLRTMMALEYDYLPSYIIFADFIEKDELLIFNGRLSWSGKLPDEQAIVSFLENQKGVFMTKFIDCTMGYHDPKIMKLFQLNYQHTMTRFENGELTEDTAFKFKDDLLKKIKGSNLEAYHWVLENGGLRELLLSLAGTQVFNYR